MRTREVESGGVLRLVGPLLTAFVASGAIMMIELTAGRLISRYLGMSLYTWTSIIAVMMAGMALGNALGGYVSDRYPPRRALGLLFLIAGVACVLLLPMNDFLGGLGALRALNWPARIFLHVSGLFFLPAVALGGIAPVVARLALALGGPQGRTVGLVYASGVAGSIFCTFLTGYYLVLLLGVNAIFFVAAGTLCALGGLYLLASLRGDDAPSLAPKAATRKQSTSAPWWPAILTVVTSNFAFMAIELGAARVLSRDYGNSVYTWTATIGVFLAGITLGNALGGWAADRSAARRVVAKYFLAASIATLAGPFLFRLVHGMFLHQPLFAGLGWSTRIAVVMASGFFVPCVFLGFISPLIVKRGLDAGRAPGKTVASVYAWGALGGVVGTLLSGYFLIDRLGSLGVICCAGVLLAAASVCYARVRVVHAVWLALSLLAAVAALSNVAPAMKLGNALALRPALYDGTIYDDESQYSFIAVRQDEHNPRVRTIILDKLEHSVIDFDHPSAFKQEYEWIYEAVFESIFPSPYPLRSFFIGGGGFIYPRYFDTTRPDGHTEVAEIDPAVTKAAYNAFGLNPVNRIEIHNMDARNRITSLAEQRAADPASVPPFDVIVGDSFNDFSVPSHLTTLEFTQQVKSLLNDKGIYLLNMIDVYSPGLFLSAFVKTLREVFPHIYIFNCGAPPMVRDTFVIVCSELPRDMSAIPRVVRMGNPYPGHLLTDAAVERLLARNPGPKLTDNYAPTELLLVPVVSRAIRDSGQEHFEWALEAINKGYVDKAIEECQFALENHPGWSDVYETLGDLYAGKGLTDIALEKYQNALEFTSDPANVRFKMGGLLLGAGKIDEGKKVLEAALAEDPGHVDSLLKLSALLLEQQNLKGAIALLERAVAKVPDNVNARYNLGFAYAVDTQFAKAVEQWEAAVRTDPNHADSLENLVQGYINLKQYDKAFDAVSRLKALGKEPPADKLEQLQRESGRTQ